MLNIAYIVTGALLILGSATGMAAEKGFPLRTLPPAGQALNDPDLARFLKDLRDTVRYKDRDTLVTMIDPEIKVDFGSAGGLVDFRRAWSLDEQALDSPLWGALGTVLAFEGVMEGALYIAPYFFAKWPDELDAYQYALITGNNVNIRVEASSRAAIARQASYEIVRIETETGREPVLETLSGETHPWIKVGLHDGNTGYVWGKFLRSPLDYRVMLHKVRGSWKVRSFLAGD